ncbi:putative transglutaminase elicitor [Plasmopara halstedii]
MRGSNIISTVAVLIALQANGVSSTLNRKLEAMRENEDLVKMEEFFGVKAERKLEKMLTSAKHEPAPWNGPSWLVMNDSMNFNYLTGEMSPAEKYARAFGLDVKDFMDKVSAQSGIDSMANRSTPCTDHGQCELRFCSKRTNATSGYCIPQWYGLSHALAPAATLEKEPLCPVVYNNVTFHPIDIKGLITAVYIDANTTYLYGGRRYNGDDNETFDANGRSSNANFRDITPAFFHIASTYLLGMVNRSFIIDRHANRNVWNQPVYGFEVIEQNPLTLEEAAQTFFNTTTYPFNANATRIVHFKSQLMWNNATDPDSGYSNLIVPPDSGMTYEYVLEICGDGYVTGGEWVRESIFVHPDFCWLMKSRPQADLVTSIGLSYADVTMLLEKSAACSDSKKSSNN